MSARKRLLDSKSTKTKSFNINEEKVSFKGVVVNVRQSSMTCKKKEGGTFVSYKTSILFYIDEIEGDSSSTTINYFKSVDKKNVKMTEDDLKSANAKPIHVKVGDAIYVSINKIENIDIKYGTLNNVYAKIEYHTKKKIYEVKYYCDGVSVCNIPDYLHKYEEYLGVSGVKKNKGFLSEDLYNGFLDQLAFITENKCKFTLSEFEEMDAREGISADVGLMAFKVIGASAKYVPTTDINHIVSQNVSKKYDNNLVYDYAVESIQNLTYSKMNNGQERLFDDAVLSEGLGSLETVVEINSFTGFNFIEKQADAGKTLISDTGFQVDHTTEKAFTGSFKFCLKFNTEDNRKIEYQCNSRVEDLMSSLQITNVEVYEGVCQINSFNFRVVMWNSNKKLVYKDIKNVAKNKDTNINVYSSLVKVDLQNDCLSEKITLDKYAAYEFCGYNSILNIVREGLDFEKTFIQDVKQDNKFKDIRKMDKFLLKLDSHRAKIQQEEVKNLDEFKGVYTFPEYEEIKLVFGFINMLSMGVLVNKQPIVTDKEPSFFMEKMGLINAQVLYMELLEGKHQEEDKKFVWYQIYKFLRVCYACMFDSLSGSLEKYKNLIDEADAILQHQNKCEYDSLDIENNNKWATVCTPITEKDISKNICKKIIASLKIVPYACPVQLYKKLKLESSQPSEFENMDDFELENKEETQGEHQGEDEEENEEENEDEEHQQNDRPIKKQKIDN